MVNDRDFRGFVDEYNFLFRFLGAKSLYELMDVYTLYLKGLDKEIQEKYAAVDDLLSMWGGDFLDTELLECPDDTMDGEYVVKWEIINAIDY